MWRIAGADRGTHAGQGKGQWAVSALRKRALNMGFSTRPPPPELLPLSWSEVPLPSWRPLCIQVGGGVPPAGPKTQLPATGQETTSGKAAAGPLWPVGSGRQPCGAVPCWPSGPPLPGRAMAMASRAWARRWLCGGCGEEWCGAWFQATSHWVSAVKLTWEQQIK